MTQTATLLGELVPLNSPLEGYSFELDLKALRIYMRYKSRGKYYATHGFTLQSVTLQDVKVLIELNIKADLDKESLEKLAEFLKETKTRYLPQKC